MAKEKNDNDKKAKGGSSGKKKSKGKKQQDETAKFSGVPADYVPRLAKKYSDEVAPALTKEFGYTSSMEVPRLEKIVVNMGVGEATGNIKLLEDAMRELTLISGQKPRMNRATRSVAQFKVREGMPVGCSVTLRGKRMYDFLDRLINVAIPRVRDFRGLPPNSFDGRGNHSLGIREQMIFTEINYNDIDDIRGMNVTTVTTAKTDAECKALLRHLGMPFRKK